MNDREVILNLWYVRDQEGIIYSLRAKAYVAEGSEEEKLAFLQERARLDYLIADSFEIPKQFHLQVQTEGKPEIMPVAHVGVLPEMGGSIALFEEAIKCLESRMQAQSDIEIPEDPLVCTTPLMQNERGVIVPVIEGHFRY